MEKKLKGGELKETVVCLFGFCGFLMIFVTSSLSGFDFFLFFLRIYPHTSSCNVGVVCPEYYTKDNKKRRRKFVVIFSFISY